MSETDVLGGSPPPLDQIRERLSKITPGPWLVRPDKWDDWGWIRGADGHLVANAGMQSRYTEEEAVAARAARFTDRDINASPPQVAANADFIAHAPEDIQTLLDLVSQSATHQQKLEQENERLRDWRATVTAAVGREGGTFYYDVPKFVRGMKKELRELEELEARLCPEDVGFDEYIPALTKRAEAAEAWAEQLAASVQTLQAEKASIEEQAQTAYRVFQEQQKAADAERSALRQALHALVEKWREAERPNRATVVWASDCANDLDAALAVGRSPEATQK